MQPRLLYICDYDVALMRIIWVFSLIIAAVRSFYYYYYYYYYYFHIVKVLYSCYSLFKSGLEVLSDLVKHLSYSFSKAANDILFRRAVSCVENANTLTLYKDCKFDIHKVIKLTWTLVHMDKEANRSNKQVE